MHFTEHGAVVD